jgi:8-oxo-dGTP diphosphatase
MRPAYGAEGIRIGGHLVTIVVDVANVMGSRPDGWWRDRAGAAVRMHAELVQLAASGRAVLPGDPDPPGEIGGGLNEVGDPPGEISRHQTDPPGFVMVLEGAAKAAAARIAPGEPAATGASAVTGGVRPGEVRVVRASGAGDDTIVAVVRELPGRCAVVTADRELRRRCAAAGATILGPGWLLGLLRS